MAQREVLALLQERHPKGMTILELSKIFEITESSVHSSLKRLQKWKEVEVIGIGDGNRLIFAAIIRKDSNGPA